MADTVTRRALVRRVAQEVGITQQTGAAEYRGAGRGDHGGAGAPLETRLGVTLFERGHRHVVLTDAGKRYVETAEQVLTLLQAGQDGARALRARRTLRIDIDYELLFFVVMARLPGLRAAFPAFGFEFLPLGHLVGRRHDDRNLPGRLGRCRRNRQHTEQRRQIPPGLPAVAYQAPERRRAGRDRLPGNLRLRRGRPGTQPGADADLETDR